MNWFYNLDTSDFEDWILAIDFNLIQSAANQNRPGWDVNVS